MLMFNQIIISLFPTVADLIPTLMIVGIFIGIGAITCLEINFLNGAIGETDF